MLYYDNMSEYYAGIDSAQFYHGGLTNFRAPFGVAVIVNDYDTFNSTYTRIVNELKAKYNVNSPRICVKGHFLSMQIGSNNAHLFVEEFLEKILPSLNFIYVNHVILPPTKVPEIFCVNGTKMSTMDFMDVLIPSFNHVIAWNLLTEFPELKDLQIFIDHFTGKRTKAWEDLDGNKNIFILPSGEYCNSLISTSDLICRYIRGYLFTNKERFGFNGISNAFEAKGVKEALSDAQQNETSNTLNGDVKLYQTNNSPFHMITPSSNHGIEVDSHLKHPVLFVLPSHRLPKERNVLEYTPIFDLLTNSAYEDCGSVHFLNPDDLRSAVRYIRHGDKIVTIGDKAFEDAKYLQNFGIDADVITSEELLKKSKVV